jgi:multicomponent Na+:H+ antiporter subunit D
MMNQLLPLFVVIPLSATFLIMIFGRFFRDFNKYFASCVLLFLVVLSFYSLINLNGGLSLYKVGGWQPVNKIPIGIYMMMDGFNSLIICIINLVGFLAVFYSISYIKRYTESGRFSGPGDS